jgi:hypothetical protein
MECQTFVDLAQFARAHDNKPHPKSLPQLLLRRFDQLSARGEREKHRKALFSEQIEMSLKYELPPL